MERIHVYVLHEEAVLVGPKGLCKQIGPIMISSPLIQTGLQSYFTWESIKLIPIE
jgi:hypothetical protein